jgi:excisionase family DNA binding protein
MEREKFAELVGVSVDTVTAWIKRGYIPSVAVGKYRLVNLVKLHTELAAGEFETSMGDA